MEWPGYVLHLEKLLYLPESEINPGVFANYCLGCGKLMKVIDLRDTAHLDCWDILREDIYCYHMDFTGEVIFLEYGKDKMKLQIKSIECKYNISKLTHGFNEKEITNGKKV